MWYIPSDGGYGVRAAERTPAVVARMVSHRAGDQIEDRDAASEGGQSHHRRVGAKIPGRPRGVSVARTSAKPHVCRR